MTILIKNKNLNMNKVSVDLDMNVQGYVQGINQATQSTADYESETRKVADAQINLMKELKAAKREVQNLAAGYAKLDSEAKKSAFGQEMARQLEEAKQKAAEYMDLQSDLQTELRNMADDARVFNTMKEGLDVLMNATSAALGLVAQFTGNEEDAKKAVVAFTTAQSVLNTVTAVYNALLPYSNTMKAVGTVKTLAQTAAIKLETAAQSKNIVVTKAATIAQAAFNKIAAMNPYVLLAMAIIGVVGAIASFIAFTDDASDSQNDLNQELEDGKKAAEDYRNTVMNAAKEYGEAAAKVKSLTEQYQNCTDELEKTQIIESAAQLFSKYGIEVHNAAEAEQKLIELGPKFAQYLELQGQIAAATALQMAAWSKAIQAALETGKDISVAIQEAANDPVYKNYGKLVTTLKARNAELGKELGIHKQIYKEEKKRSTTSSNKTDVKAAAGSIAAIKKEIADLQERAEKGALPKELQDPTKFKAKIDALQKQLKELQIKWGFEKPDTKLQQLENAVKEAESAFIIAVDADDKDAQRAAYESYQTAQKKLDEYKLTIKLEPEVDEATLEKQATEIGNKVAEALNPKTELSAKYDFSGLGEIDTLEQFQKPAQELIDTMHRIEDARKELTEIMNSPGATDTQIAAAKAGLEQLNTEYDNLIEKADAYQILSDGAIELINTNKKLADTYNTVADCVGSVGDAFSALADISEDDPALKVLGIVAQAVANMFAGYAQATVAAAQTGNPWVWAAFAASGLAQTLAMVAQIKSAAQFADGGIVGGNSYSGDRLTARVNSGEMILNQRQQKNLFNMLDQGLMPQRGGQLVQVQGVIRGTDLILVQKNTSKVMKKAGNTINF